MRKPRSDAVRSFYISLGRQIAATRQRQRITQEGIAAEVGLSRTSIVNIENGKQQLLLHTWLQIARALKVEPAELIPEVLPTEQSISDAISQFVGDPAGRAWIEATLGKDSGKSRGN